MLKISSCFDAGNIKLISCESVHAIRLSLQSDAHSDHRQWFHFRLQGAAHQHCSIQIEALNETSFPQGWHGYQAVASYDLQQWFRVPTSFDEQHGDGVLRIEYTPLADSVYYAYFEPYPWARHLQLLAQAQNSNLCRILDLGSTPDGRDFNMLVIGREVPSDRKLWITARQHPGESMAQWWVEGFLNRLLDDQDASAQTLLDKATFYIIPNMNPDGSVRGHLRTNAHGVDLNRAWQNTTLAASPEVFRVRETMQQVGVDFYLDVHGDETIPYVFLVGTEGVPSYDEHMMRLEETFINAGMLANPDLQDEHGYEKIEASQANLNMASNYVGENFRCLSLILEMPFKDNSNRPDPNHGWDGRRSFLLGSSMLTPILAVVDKLR